MRFRVAVAAASLAIYVALAVPTLAGNQGRGLDGQLVGFNEVPVVSTIATGTFEARVAPDGDSFDWTLTFQDLESDSRQAHIHVGQPDVNGGISVWLCDSATNPAPDPNVELCPTRAGSVSGTADASDVVGPTGQLIMAGEFDELLEAIRAGNAYVNVHSSGVPSGEIRSQVR